MEQGNHRAAELLRKKRYLEAAAEAAKEQQACCERELALKKTAQKNARRSASLWSTMNECSARLAKAEEELALIRCAYAVLTPYQQDLLDSFFVNGEKYCADRLCERYFKERSSLYRDRRKALDAFSLAAFGDVEE